MQGRYSSSLLLYRQSLLFSWSIPFFCLLGSKVSNEISPTLVIKLPCIFNPTDDFFGDTIGCFIQRTLFEVLSFTFYQAAIWPRKRPLPLGQRGFFKSIYYISTAYRYKVGIFNKIWPGFIRQYPTIDKDRECFEFLRRASTAGYATSRSLTAHPCTLGASVSAAERQEEGLLAVAVSAKGIITAIHLYSLGSDALSVDDGSTVLVVVLLGDPHAGECGQGGEGGTTSPDGEPSVGAGNDLDGDGLGGSVLDFLEESLADALVHGGATGEDDVLIEIASHVDIALLDGVVGQLLDGGQFLAVHLEGLEQILGASEALVADGDDLTVGHLVVLLEGGAVLGLLEGLLVVKGNEAELLLDVSHDFELGGGGELVASLGEELGHELGQVATGDLDLGNGVGDGETLIDGDGVGDTIAGVADDTGGSTSGVEGEHGLDGNVHAGHVEGLEHDLGHLLSVDLGVQGGLGQEDGVLIGGDSELHVEGVVPDLLHIIPVLDDTVLDGIGDLQHSSLLLGLVTEVLVLGADSDEDGDVLGATHDGGEDGSGSVFTGETGLDDTRTVIDDDDLLIFCHALIDIGYAENFKYYINCKHTLGTEGINDCAVFLDFGFILAGVINLF